MAVYHCQMKPISRRGGRSAVAAAAYRAGESIRDTRQGMTFDFSKKGGVMHAEIVLPKGVSAEWAQDREELWNAAEAAEKRKDARTAREFEIALPVELDPDARRELAVEFARHLADTYRVAVDVAVHAPSKEGDERNHHAHLLCTTREVETNGLGKKTALETRDAVLKERNQPTGAAQLKALRQTWADLTNGALERAGHDVRVDHRSHRDRGLKIEPSRHEGVGATHMRRKGWQTERQRLDALARSLNAQAVRERPEQLLELVTAERSVFTRADIERAMWRCSVDKREIAALAEVVIASAETVLVQREPDDMPRGSRPARYSTREMIAVETRMAADVCAMKEASGFAVPREHVDRGIAAFDAHLGARGAALAAEQREVVEYLADEAAIGVVVGHAGAGKSTTLAAARFSWESAGHRVLGAALAGKAAESLQQASGIPARTLAAWEAAWSRGDDLLETGDVLIVDEAGMVCARQMGRVATAARKAGAKLVLVGDAEQLQAIGPGASFRAIADRVGAVGLEVVRRQVDEWQRAATRAFAATRTTDGLRAYAERKRIVGSATAAGAREALAKAYVGSWLDDLGSDHLALAHRRADVADLNERIRANLRQAGRLAGPDTLFEVRDSEGDAIGERGFSEGDRILFLRNDRTLGVKNGSLGWVTGVRAETLDVVLDDRRELQVNTENYDQFDHGYATTVHKAQGATVDKTFVLASDMMDRHLTYVALSRHRVETTMFVDRSKFLNIDVLSSHLSRVGLKDTVLDYFDDPASVVNVPARDSSPSREPEDVEQVLARLGDIAWKAARARSERKPIPDALRDEWRVGARDLERVWSGTSAVLGRAFQRDTEFYLDLAWWSGSDDDDRSLADVIRGGLERRLRFEATPEGRLELLVDRWTRTERELATLYGTDDRNRRIGWKAVTDGLRDVQKAAQDDAGVMLMFRTGTAELPDEVRAGLERGLPSRRLLKLKAQRAQRAEHARRAARSGGKVPRREPVAPPARVPDRAPVLAPALSRTPPEIPAPTPELDDGPGFEF